MVKVCVGGGGGGGGEGMEREKKSIILIEKKVNGKLDISIRE